jgi:hypothetical protein
MTVSPPRKFTVAVWSVSFAVALFVLGWLALAYDPLSGAMPMATSFAAPHPFVSEMKPPARVEETDDGQRLVASPAYFDARTPTRFDRVTVEAEFDPGDSSLVEIGALATADGRFETIPAFSRLVEELGWSRIADGGLSLYQRTPSYETVDDFLREPPSPERVAFLGDAAEPNWMIPGHQPSPRVRSYSVSLRGAHRFYVYLGEEALDLRLLVQDANRMEGADPVRLAVFATGGDEPLAEVSLPDDGDVSPDSLAGEPRELAIRWTPSHAGFYFVTLDATDDVFVREIATPQTRFGLVGRVYVGDEAGFAGAFGKPWIVFASGRSLEAKAMTAEAMQTLEVGKDGLTLPAPGEVAATALANGPVRIRGLGRGLVLSADGIFAFDADALVPRPLAVKGVTKAEDLDSAGVDYLLTNYAAPAREGTTVVGRFSAETDDLALTREGDYRFVIKFSPVGGRGAVIKDVRFFWERPRITVAAWVRRLLTPSQALQTVDGFGSPRPALADFDESIP